MKTISLFTALVIVLLLSANAQQERYTKTNNISSQQEQIIYQPVDKNLPIKMLSSDGGGIAECFYYGDPCGMFLDKEWQEGEAHLVDGSAMTGSFRYNICGQKMEAIVEGDTFAFARPGELDKIRIADSRFVYCNYMRSDGELASSWFELLCKGNCSLMLRRYIKYRVTDGDEDHSNDLLYRIQEYYSCTGNNVLERLYLSKKDLMEKLKDHEREVAEYIKSERLNLKDHEDLVRIVDYYNNLD